jgi:hypothetical protein
MLAISVMLYPCYQNTTWPLPRRNHFFRSLPARYAVLSQGVAWIYPQNERAAESDDGGCRAGTSRAPRRRFHVIVALVCCGSRQSRLSKFLSLHDYISVEHHGGGSTLTAPRTHIITKQGQHGDEATSVPPNAASRRHPFPCTASPPCLAC